MAVAELWCRSLDRSKDKALTGLWLVLGKFKRSTDWLILRHKSILWHIHYYIMCVCCMYVGWWGNATLAKKGSSSPICPQKSIDKLTFLLLHTQYSVCHSNISLVATFQQLFVYVSFSHYQIWLPLLYYCGSACLKACLRTKRWPYS